jgi:predicted ATPase
MLSYIKINGFKSFHNFEMSFSPFTIIAGINASGKSNLFDALQLISRLAEVENIKKAFKEQRGEFRELFTQLDEDTISDKIDFTVEMLVNKCVTDAWGNTTNLKYTRLRYKIGIQRVINESTGMEDLIVKYEYLENLKHNDDEWIRVIPADLREMWRPKVTTGKRGIPYMTTENTNGIPTVLVPQDGTTGNKRRFPLHNSTRTVLSSFDTIDFPHVLAAKEEMKSWKFLQLNPDELRKPTPKDSGEDTIDQHGKNLAAALFRIKQQDPYYLVEISRKLHSFLPEFISVDVIDDKENKQFIIKLKDKDNKEYTSRVLSEGTLRILTLCVIDYDEKFSGLLCFEEPENGIHPFRIKDMANLLKDLSSNFKTQNITLRQVIVNTHSPVLVRYVQSWSQDGNVSLWFAKMHNRIIDFDTKRIKVQLTKLTPVSKDRELPFDVTDQESKLTLNNVEQYLESINNA